MRKLLRIRELKVNANDESGVFAISFVDYPAIESNFEYFAATKPHIRTTADITSGDLDHKYKWILGSEEDPCPACVEWSKRSPQTLREWIKTALPRVPVGQNILGLTTQKSWDGERKTEGGPTYNTFCEDACRCHLEAVSDNLEKHFNVEFKIDNEEKREVVGCVLKSNQTIYRKDVGGGPGYVWFSRETVRQSQKKFGYNRNVTFQHVQNRTGSVIMMKSWLQEDKETEWFIKYKVIDNNLWEQIKKGVVRGFSIEARFI